MLLEKIFSISEQDSDYTKNVTIYYDSDIPAKAVLLYFHGGGLLYGSREDLPEFHLHTLTEAGNIILAFDYPLAPMTKLNGILPDVIQSIQSRETSLARAGLPTDLPYFIWGRSAGAYLVLLAAASDKLDSVPAGIISYYGYGMLTDHWYDTPSNYYNSFPSVGEDCLPAVDAPPSCEGDIHTHYFIYLYARQQGKWKDLIYEGRDKFFFIDYSLRLKDTLPAPLFCAHSMHDNDVPFAEFLALTQKYPSEQMIAAAGEHDFDRHTDDPFTAELLKRTVLFIEKNI